jgi:hypothetical protein
MRAAAVMTVMAITRCTAVVALATACTNDDVDDAALPRVATAAECTDGAPPTLCEWVTSHDAVAVGVIEALQPLQSPAVPAGTTELVDGCVGASQPGVKVVINFNETVRGAAPDRIGFRVGGAKASTWDPRPFVDGAGELTWLGGAGALEVGQTIGVGMHHSEAHKVWSLLFDSLFVVDDDGRVTFQRGAFPCGEPIGPDGRVQWSDLRASGTTCDGDEGAAALAAASRMIEGDGDPSTFMAARCFGDGSGP